MSISSVTRSSAKLFTGERKQTNKQASQENNTNSYRTEITNLWKVIVKRKKENSVVYTHEYILISGIIYFIKYLKCIYKYLLTVGFNYEMLKNVTSFKKCFR